MIAVSVSPQDLDDGAYHDDDEQAGQVSVKVQDIVALEWATSHTLGLGSNDYTPALVLHVIQSTSGKPKQRPESLPQGSFSQSHFRFLHQNVTAKLYFTVPHSNDYNPILVLHVIKLVSGMANISHSMITQNQEKHRSMRK